MVLARDLAKERFWRKHVTRQGRSSLNIRAYCAEHDLIETSFYSWRRELARRGLVPYVSRRASRQPVSSRRPDARRPDASSRVRLRPRGPSQQQPSRRPEDVPFAEVVWPSLTRERLIEITLSNGTRVAVQPGATRELVREVLSALREPDAAESAGETRAC